MGISTPMAADVIVILAVVAAVSVSWGLPYICSVYRRHTWISRSGTVQSACFEVVGETAMPLIDVSYDIGDRRFEAKRLSTGELDLGDLGPGSVVALLVHPRFPCRCIVDRRRWSKSVKEDR